LDVLRNLVFVWIEDFGKTWLLDLASKVTAAVAIFTSPSLYLYLTRAGYQKIAVTS
jgi:hypothetical protein